MLLHRPGAFFRRFGASGLIGFGESYQAGDWDCADLTELLTVLAATSPTSSRPGCSGCARSPSAARRPPTGRQEKVPAATSRHHYDLSNDLFALFLDQTMTYSSALFATDTEGEPEAGEHLLARRQRRKIDRLLDRAGVGPGRGCSRSAPAGASWRCEPPNARGAAVTVTLSRGTAGARQTARRRGRTDRQVSVQLRDYRDVEGTFDAVVSCEMIEAVGERYWPTATSPPSTGTWRPAAASACRRSPCRTTGCWPPGTPTPGSTSTSSPAAMLPSITAVRTAWPAPPGSAVIDRARLRPALRGNPEDLAGPLQRTRNRGRRPRLRRGVQPHVDLLPVLLGGRLRSGYLDVTQLTLARI